MNRALMLLVLIAVWVIGGAAAVWAQDFNIYIEPDTGCEADIVAAIEPASDISFGVACDAYLTCMAESSDSTACQLEAASVLLSACEPDDRVCRNISLLHIASIALYQPPYGDEGLVMWRSEKDRLFPDVLHLISVGDYDAAAEVYRGPYDLLYSHEMEYYAAGLIDELRGLPDEALSDYSGSERINPTLWLMMFSRAQLLGVLDRATEASLDTARLAEFVNEHAPDMLPLITPLTEEFPLDTLQFSTWLAYPVIQHLGDLGGETFLDQTLEEPVTVELAYYLHELKFAVRGFPGFYDYDELQVLSWLNNDSRYLFERRMGDVTSIEGFQPADRYSGNGVTFYVQPAAIIATSYRGTYILRPEGTEDIRPALGTRVCEEGVISRLKPDMPVTRSSRSGPLSLSSEPAEHGLSDPDFWSGIVLDREPVCVGSGLWWYVQEHDGSTGWIAENKENEYLLNPEHPSNWGFLYCPTAVESRLFTGAWVRMTEDSPNHRSVAPGRNSGWLDRLEPRTVLEVVGNPECQNGRVWWEVRTENGLTGFMEEANADTYFLEPVPDSP